MISKLQKLFSHWIGLKCEPTVNSTRHSNITVLSVMSLEIPFLVTNISPVLSYWMSFLSFNIFRVLLCPKYYLTECTILVIIFSFCWKTHLSIDWKNSNLNNYSTLRWFLWLFFWFWRKPNKIWVKTFLYFNICFFRFWKHQSNEGKGRKML